jgi:hypothetical protein
MDQYYIYKGKTALILNLGTKMQVIVQLHAPPALPLVKNSGTHQIGVWVVLRTSLDNFGEERISCPYQALNHRLCSHC